MKKILIFSILAFEFGSFNVYANSNINNQKITVVKYLYDKELAPIDSKFRVRVTPELRSLLVRDDKGTKRAAGGYMDMALSCQDILFPTVEEYDDPIFVPIQNSIRYQVVPNGNVRASFTNSKGENKIIHYKMICKNNKCLISDIIGSDGSSYANQISQCLRKKRY